MAVEKLSEIDFEFDEGAALYKATNDKDLVSVRDLIENEGVNVNTRVPITGETALHVATRNNSLVLVEYLLEKKADPNIKSEGGITPFIIAATDNNITILCRFLESIKMDLDESDDIGETSFCKAAARGHVEVCRLLKNAGANIDARNKFGDSPLKLAVRHAGNKEVVKYLCDVGVDLNSKSNIGISALSRAANEFVYSGTHLDILETLMSYGVCIDEDVLKLANGNETLKCLTIKYSATSADSTSNMKSFCDDKSSTELVANAASDDFKDYYICSKDLKLLSHVGSQSTIENERHLLKNKCVGSGGFGMVFAGLTDKHEKIAVKLVRINDWIPEVLAKKSHYSCYSVCKDVIKEVNVLSALSHPNILRYFSSELRPYYLRIAMEFIEGCTFKNLAKKNGVTQKDMAMFLKQILNALSYLHQKRIVHRDIKGDNIMIQDANGPHGDRIAKLIDFGLARKAATSITPEGTTKTVAIETNRLCGTKDFFAPEIANADVKTFTQYSDIWAFGCMIYEVCNKGEQMKLSYERENHVLPYNEVFHSDFYENLSDMFVQCLEKEYTDRPRASVLEKHSLFSMNYISCY